MGKAVCWGTGSLGGFGWSCALQNHLGMVLVAKGEDSSSQWGLVLLWDDNGSAENVLWSNEPWAVHGGQDLSLHEQQFWWFVPGWERAPPAAGGAGGCCQLCRSRCPVGDQHRGGDGQPILLAGGPHGGDGGGGPGWLTCSKELGCHR